MVALRILKLNAFTYGTSSTPFLSFRCLNYLAEMYSKTYVLGSRAIFHNIYVDDMLAGANSKDELVRLKSEVVKVLDYEKFELHKWRSNYLDLSSTQETFEIKRYVPFRIKGFRNRIEQNLVYLLAITISKWLI